MLPVSHRMLRYGLRVQVVEVAALSVEAGFSPGGDGRICGLPGRMAITVRDDASAAACRRGGAGRRTTQVPPP